MPIENHDFQFSKYKKQSLGQSRSHNQYILYNISIMHNEKMSSTHHTAFEGKLNKCKSLQNWKFKNGIIFNSPKNPTSPKFELIKPKNSIDNHSQFSEAVGARGLCRIKSADRIGLAKLTETKTFDNIVDLYKKENDNLKQQNKYLIKQIKKREKNEEVLTNYISQLRRELKDLERNKSISPMTSRSKLLSNSKISKQESVQLNSLYYNGFQKDSASLEKQPIIIEEAQTRNTISEIQELSDRFQMLLEQCSKESCRKNRVVIREKLAETALRLKTAKKQFNL